MIDNNDYRKLSLDAFNKYKKGNWGVHILNRCVSTFDIAKEKIKEKASHGTLIIAETQTGGKGRQARKWLSPQGGIWMSIILKPRLDLSLLSSITLLCAVAVSKTIEEMFPQLNPEIKWPNDIYINSKKVSGMLTETIVQKGSAEYSIVGIGINANNTSELMDEEVKMTSISFNDMGIHVNREQMASCINDKLQDLISTYVKEENLDFILDYYHKHMHWVNEEAVMKNTITNEVSKKGIIRGIDKQGQLLMEIDGQVEKIVSGELSLRRE